MRKLGTSSSITGMLKTKTKHITKKVVRVKKIQTTCKNKKYIFISIYIMNNLSWWCYY